MAARDTLALPLLLAVHALVGCQGGGGTSESAGASSSGGQSGVDMLCPGVAYTRTDVPGTALCLNGLESFQCAWTSKNPAINGHKIEGSHDAASDVLTLAYPDDPERTSFTTYTFDTKFGFDGVDLVLTLMGARAGDYQEVGGWAEAVDGDGGLCGGGGAACDGPCSSDADCGSGQACFATSEGDKCLPTACDTCFDADQFCNYFTAPCEFEACSAAAVDRRERLRAATRR